ncbi:MAG: ATP-grasp domain-containing protein [Acidobacteria bacterium]|nr:ATP-grasp domain-containing protein [Acidobacteriota bacterium]
MTKAPTILCVSGYFKGSRFIETCKREGCTVYLLTIEKLLKEPWPRHAIDEVWALPDFENDATLVNTVAYLARNHEIDRIAPLDDYDVERVARLREFMRVPGMGETTARYFRDKLAMRSRAEFRGLPIPRFVHVLNHARIDRFMCEVPPPWMFKPRAEASSIGIKKLSTPEEVWKVVEELGDLQSRYLLEQMIPGDVYHVDSIVSEGEVVFAEASKYKRPLFDVTHSGGIFATTLLARDDSDTIELMQFNKELVRHLGFVRGVLHTEFIKGHDEELYFLETAARVGGAHIAEMVEAATGVNLWEEWAKIEVSQGEFPYVPPTPRKDYAGLIVSLARQERPDTSAYNDPEIVWRLDKKHHVGFIVTAPTPERVEELVDAYMPRIERDFSATLPAPAKPTA